MYKDVNFMTAPTNAKKSKAGIYFKGVKAEMRKVIWPTKKELINYTGMVIIISTIVAVTVSVLDLVINSLLKLII